MLAAIFISVLFNQRFWGVVFGTLPDAPLQAAGLLVALTAALTALTTLIMLPLSVRGVLKPGLVLVLLLTAVAAHFTREFSAAIDRHALASVIGTDLREAREWLSVRMLLELLFAGLVPGIVVCLVRIRWRQFWPEVWSRLRLAALCLVVLGLSVAGFGREIASLLRNHQELKHLALPYALVAASLSYLDHARDDGTPMQAWGADARRAVASAGARPVVVVMVIGESARASSFALDGYLRPTNPEMSTMPMINFGNVSSCGTNTATSLPCMFSGMGRASYDDAAAGHRENVLDVIRHAGYDVLWLDNNTGSKGVAARAREVDFSTAHEPAYCHAEGCWDGILVEHLRAELQGVRRDTVIVLHLLGSHGPAYYLRYPPQFARFKPECRTNELQKCTRQQIINTYDNSILYTDHVLAGVVHALQQERALDGTMLFVSDHGESTGERQLYLHGAPYVLAPREQTWVPMLLWVSESLGRRRGLEMACLRHDASRRLSHDNLVHTLLGLAAVETSVYRRDLDALANCRGATAGKSARGNAISAPSPTRPHRR